MNSCPTNLTVFRSPPTRTSVGSLNVNNWRQTNIAGAAIIESILRIARNRSDV
jgi:hypothetical protein